MSKGNTNGAVVWENKEICFVLTGLEKPSDNIKTGPMVQSYILRKDMHPNDAVKAGKDEAICGKCVFRGDGTGKGRGCYVNLAFGVGAVWRSLKNYCGRVSRLTGKALRLGAYGDPYFVPVDILRKYSNLAKKITGYTHQWREDDAGPYAEFCMASVESKEGKAEAQAKGFRTFRVVSDPSQIDADEIFCPATAEGAPNKEAWDRINCEDCGLCNGNFTGKKINVAVLAHGSKVSAGRYAKEIAV
jgi:hypothetical protein